MGRIKAKRVKRLVGRLDGIVPPYQKYTVHSEIDGCFLSFGFSEGDEGAMEIHWTQEVMECAVGDCVELLEDGETVRRFEGTAWVDNFDDVSSVAYL
mgnify:CR=1 FL=1|jgi:hypothetical protein